MLKRIPFLRIVIFYVSGIIIARGFPEVNTPVLLIILIGLIPLLIFLNSKNTNYFLISSTISIFLVLAGIANYSNYNRNPEFLKSEKYIATILEYPVEKTNSFKTESLLKYLQDSSEIIETNEKLIIYYENDSAIKNLQPGDQIIFTTPPDFIKNRGNPNEFDYQGYMANQKIYRQVYLSSGNWNIIIKNCVTNARILSEKIRNSLLNIYLNNNIRDERFAILSALTLGYKDALDPETKNLYSSTGAMHVLAVSGLHVGIIFLAINFMLGFLKKSRYGRLIFIIVAILILWFYAILTGLSPSVLRATVMFNVLIIGDNLRRPSNIYNSLAISAFILLLFNPNLLFETGFQLSYSAVTGIVFFQPKINNLIKTENTLLKYIWALFSVAVAAQFSTFPLTIFYFHQFPTYFWISNFIVIPSAFALIFLAIATIVFSSVSFISFIFSKAIIIILDSSYFLLNQIQEFPYSVFQNIHIDKIQLFIFFVIIILLMFFIERKKVQFLFAIISVLIVFFSINTFHKFRCINHDKIIFYNTSNDLLIHLICCNKNYVIYKNTNQLNSYDYNMVNCTLTANHLNNPVLLCSDSIYSDQTIFLKKSVLVFKDKCICLDKEKATELPELKMDIIYSHKKKEYLQMPSCNNFITSANYWQNKIPKDIYSLKEYGAFIYNF